MKDWLILLCIGIIAFLAFRERDLWLPQSLTIDAPPSTQGRNLAPPNVDVSGAHLLAPGPGLAAAVDQSQRAAVAKYPALKVAGSEINVRFAFRYKNLVADHSPRLQDPAWPLQLADECAVDSRLLPATPAPATPGVAAAPPGGVRPASPTRQSLRVSPSAPGPGPDLGLPPR